MKLFLDTAHLADIRWAAHVGLIDGVTTNPTLMAKHAGDVDPTGGQVVTESAGR